MALYTGFRPRPLLFTLATVFTAVGALNVLRANLLHDQIGGLAYFTLPWGERLAFADATDSVWLTLFLLAQLAASGYLLVACVLQYRRGERQAALILGAGLVWFIVTIIVDVLVDSGVIDFFFLSDFGFLGLAVAMALQMANQVIRTEEDLARHKNELEVLVQERTAELQMASQRLVLREREAAALDERSRLARDLHDAVTQTIYSASLIVEVLPQVWERSAEEGRRNLGKLRQLIRGALAEMRSRLFELRPAALQAADLVNLLEQLSDTLTGRTRIPVELTVQGEPDLPPEVKVTIYRMAQEVFNNIAKHSRASQVTVDVRTVDRETTVSIADNGRGFDPRSVIAHGMGQSILHERAREIGASLLVKSRPGHGTQVTLVWPSTEAQPIHG